MTTPQAQTPNIDALIKAFVKDINVELTRMRTRKLSSKIAKPALKAKKPVRSVGTPSPAASAVGQPPVITFKVSKSRVSKGRTPEEQAALVVAGTSRVCWSSHMADKARHVLLFVDGKLSWHPRNAFGRDFEAFKKTWGSVMKKHGLKNAGGGDGWPSWDPLHLELPSSKISHSDPGAKRCLDEYARLTRVERKSPNASFETKYKTLLAPYIKKHTPAKKSKAKTKLKKKR